MHLASFWTCESLFALCFKVVAVSLLLCKNLNRVREWEHFDSAKIGFAPHSIVFTRHPLIILLTCFLILLLISAVYFI